MKSRTSLFNRTIVLNLLQRYWVGYAAYLFIMGAAVVVPLINALQSQGRNATVLPYYAAVYQLLSNISSVIVVNFIAVAVAAALLFSFLYNARHTGMMASLPVKRETMYRSVSAAVVGGMTACNILIYVLCLIIEILYGQVHVGALGLMLLVSTGSIIAFFGIAAFCCMLTGNIFAGPAVYVIFNFLTVGGEALIYELLRKLVYGMSFSSAPVTQFLSPVLMIGEHVGFHYEPIYDSAEKWIDYTWKLNGLGVLAIYAAVGLVFLWLGMLLYKNRRMETAGDTISIEILKPIFRLCCTVGAGMVFALFVSNLLYQISPKGWGAAIYLSVLLIIGGTLGYFISQMLITKTVNVFRSGWKAVGIYAVCAFALVAAIEADAFGFERRVPEYDNVKQVLVNSLDGNNITFDEPENIKTVLALHESLIANKALHEMDYGAADTGYYQIADDEPAVEWNSRTLQITYTLENGKLIKRRYPLVYGPEQILDMSSDIRTVEALINTEEGISERCIVDYPVTLNNVQGAWIDFVEAGTYENKHFGDFSPSEIAQFYNDCIVPDIRDGNLGIIDLIEDRDYALSKYNCTIAIEVYKEQVGRGYTEYRSIVLYPSLESARTLAFLKEYGIEPAVVYDSMLADGFDYNEFGRYRIDGDALPSYGEMTAEARSAQIIGGADGPTAVYVTK